MSKHKKKDKVNFIGVKVKRYDDGRIVTKIRRKPETTKHDLMRLVDEGIDKVEQTLGKF